MQRQTRRPSRNAGAASPAKTSLIAIWRLDATNSHHVLRNFSSQPAAKELATEMEWRDPEGCVPAHADTQSVFSRLLGFYLHRSKISLYAFMATFFGRAGSTTSAVLVELPPIPSWPIRTMPLPKSAKIGTSITK